MGRAKGSGSLVKRGKYFTAVWKVDGKVHTRSTKCSSKREALDKLNEFVHPYQVKSEIETLENLQSQINVLEDERKKTPLENAIKLFFAIDEYKKDINLSSLSEYTESRYNSQMNVFRKFLKDKTYMYEITVEDAESFMTYIKNTKSVSTFNTYLKVFKTLWKVLMKHDSNIRKNPFKHLKQLKDNQSTYRRAFTDEEVKQLIEAAEGYGFECGLFFKLGAYTGMRREDCRLLLKSDVSLEEGLIRRVPIKTKKTGVTATIPITNEIYDDLKKAIETSDNEYVLPKFAKYKPFYLTEKIDNVFNKVGIKQCERDKYGKNHHTTGFHSFRHTMTKKLYRQKIPINVIMAIMGHKTVDMSLHYGSAIENDIKAIDLSNDLKDTKVKKELYAKVMSYGDGNDTFSDALEKMIAKLKDQKIDTEKWKKEEEERKKREEAELDALIAPFFDKNGNPI